ncbi:hypothetical protein diail_10627 [Diaporthe ilicicola]|nr:hypothetical protein diail_10627 [Diaporthe ilicicola]
MAPSKDELNKIAHEAERDLNSYQAKQGLNNVSVDDAGVDSIVEKKFPGAQVKSGDEISTNAGYNRRIPPEEGGELDDRGRQVTPQNTTQTTGKHFDGIGGPEDKLAKAQEDRGGDNDNDVITNKALRSADIVGAGKDRKGRDILAQGDSAATANVGTNPPGPGGNKFPGSDYSRPDPDSISAEGNVPPGSATEAPR